MSNIFITNGVGNLQTLEQMEDYKIPIYASKAAITSDISNLDANQLAGSVENTALTVAGGAAPAITVVNNYFNTSLNDSGWQTISGLSLQSCPVPGVDWGNLDVTAWRKNNKVMLRGFIRMGTGYLNGADWQGDGIIATGIPSKYRPISEVTCFVYGHGEYDAEQSEGARALSAAFSTFGIDENGRLTIHNYNSRATSYICKMYRMSFELVYDI